MSVANLCTSGNLNAMKSDEGNDSLDNFIIQAVGKEPILPFSRTGDSPVQWIQLLHSLEQPDLPGWPLLTPVKVQMQKCEKCSREFCSPINYRRHIRVHRRSLNVDKESHKNKDLLAAFWDKLSLKESMEIVSLSDVMLKDIPGSSIIRALASSLRKPGLWTLPPVYVKAGSALLDIIHAKPSRLPISSQELFSILDNASERTFLCAGTADSVQKYVFDVEAAKNSLELKNLVACTGFLFELQLVKAWVADKDAEALRCHKLLVEEEEATQKRQAELLERKKQKKLRQKEQKFKEHLYEGNGYLNVTVDAVDGPVLDEASATSSPSDSDSNSPNADKFILSYLDSIQNRNKEEETDIEAQLDFNTEHIILDDFQTVEPSAYDHQHIAINNWQVPKSHKAGRNGFVFRKNLQALKPEATQKLRSTKGQVLVHGNKVWTRKFKPNSAGEGLKATLPGEISCQIEDTNSEVMIGSISVALKVCDSRKHECRPDESIDTPIMEHAILDKNNIVEELTKADSVQSGTKGEAISTSPVQSSEEESDVMCGMSSMNDRFSSSERCVPSHSPDNDDDDRDSGKDASLLSGETPQQERAPFSSITAKEFLALRWKKAVSADHVRLVLSSGPETPGNSDKVATEASVLGEISVLGTVENRLGRHSKDSRKSVNGSDLSQKMWLFKRNGTSGFSSSSTAEEVTNGIDGSGLTAIVTGASSGIGSETARVLALRGVQVVMGVRNVSTGKQVKEVIVNEIPAAKVDTMELDLSSMASVRKFASEFTSSGRPLNLLINNAGIMGTPFKLSKDNIELQFATNHLGHFLLTNLLLDTMKRTVRETKREGRIVNVSSEAHRLLYREGICFDRLNDQEGYNRWLAYGQSKLSNLLHANELARRLKEDGFEITVNSLHPGVVTTNLFRHSGVWGGNLGLFEGFLSTLGKLVFKNVQQGASTTCYLALHPQLKGTTGAYFADNNMAKASAKAGDTDMAKRLWDFSMDLIK